MVTETSLMKELPHSREAEEALLGAVLLNSRLLIDILDVVGENDFHELKNRVIFQHLSRMWEKGDPIDVLTLQESLKLAKELDKAGGPLYIDQLFDRVPSTENAKRYGMIVREMAIKRQIASLGQELIETSLHSKESSDAILDEVGQKFINLAQGQIGAGNRSMSDIVDKLYPELQRRKTEKGFSGLKTGYSDIDNMLGGLQKSDLIILAARPSVGKTALALNIAENVASEGKSVAFFSLEMSAEQLALRLLTSMSGVNSHRIRNGNISDREWDEISSAMNKMDKLKIFINDNPSITPLQIRAEARRLALDPQSSIDLMVVDYLQLIHPSSGRYFDSKVHEVTEISRSLKSLAREMKIPLLALSQLSRAPEQQNRSPRLSDLRESGALEQDADIVMFIHREEDDKLNLDDSRTNAQLIVAKHRNGPTGMIKMQFDKVHTRFFVEAKTKEAEFDDERSYGEDDL